MGEAPLGSGKHKGLRTMAHNIDMTTGKPAIAYVGETPWHGMGTVMQPGQDIHSWAVAAGLDWQAVKVPAGFQVGDEWKPSGRYSVIRDDTMQELGVFTDRYKIVQPEDVLAFFRDFILTDERFQLETAGALSGGAKIWALAKFNENMDVMGEDHCPYVMLTTSFDGSLATTAQATLIRVVCNNTLTASIFAKDSATVKVRHNQVWNEKTAKQAHEQLEQVASTFGKYQEMAQALAGIRMSMDQTNAFFKDLLGFDEQRDQENAKRKRKFNQVEALHDAYETTLNEGTEGMSGWTAFNAVTRWVDHDRSTRRTSNNESEGAARMASAFFGSGAALKARAADLLLAA